MKNYKESLTFQDFMAIVEAKVDWKNRDKENVQDRINVLRDRNRRLQSDHPEVPSGKYQTDFRRKRHEESRGKKK
jgi:acetone carboxylase gamma subunit